MYPTEACMQAFQNLYKNTDGLTDAWGQFWAHFVKRTAKDNPAVLGVELINEPFAGNIYADPLIAVPRFGDGWNLEGAYKDSGGDR